MAFQINYSRLDRTIHRIAFAQPAIQLAAADMEDSMFGSAYEPFRARRPVFISSLPRAGTTLMLQTLNRFPTVASHTYRDMPFVLAPVIWRRISATFRKKAQQQERAHGDGMTVDYDSPEAFEEVFWKTHWPDKYRDDRIELWRHDDADAEAGDFFRRHMRKVVFLRCPERPEDGRYVSKNNGNIARLEFLKREFSDAAVVVPVREPLQHANSLHRQHLNFASMQEQDPFVRRYMADIGHYEFGDLHRPIAFPGIDEMLGGRSPDTLEYWLGYWVCAFEHVASIEGILSPGYESLCSSPKPMLAALLDELGIDDEGHLDAAAAQYRVPRARDIDVSGMPAELVERARDLYRNLTADWDRRVGHPLPSS